MDVLRDGFLLHRQKSAWKKRYFVLSRTHLLCFKDEEQMQPDSKFDFDLSSGAVNLEVLPEDQKKGGTSGASEWRFALTQNGERCIWAAASSEELNDWATAIASILGVVKSGILYKRGQDGKMHRQNWKKRYFVMTNDSIRWFREVGGEQRGEMKLTEHVMLEIQPPDVHKTGNSPSSEWRLRITAGDRKLLIATDSQEEMHAWAAALQSIVGGNLILEGSTAENKAMLNTALSSLTRIMDVDRLIAIKESGGMQASGATSPAKKKLARASMFGQDNQMLVRQQTATKNRLRQDAVRKSLATGAKGAKPKMRFSIMQDSPMIPEGAAGKPAGGCAGGGPVASPSVKSRRKTREQVAEDTKKAAVAKTLEGAQLQVWCPDPVEGWILRTVVRRDYQARTVEVERLDLSKEDRKDKEADVVMNNARIRTAAAARKNVLMKKRLKTTFKAVETQPLDPTHVQDLDDIADMDNLHEAPLLDLLRRRHARDAIYTHVGDILVSVNPFKPILDLYNLPADSELCDRATASLRAASDGGTALDGLSPFSPHVFSTADRAYAALLQGIGHGKVESQSILVSGESGAGKTEACKYIMRYLAAASQAMQPDARAHDIDVEQCLLQSNPLLEAFGNAVTLRNHNSSRFGKLIRISYDTRGCMVGAHTQHFLLEKSRVVAHCVGERNYHIFYQLTQDAGARESLSLLGTGKYAYLQDQDDEPLEGEAGGDGKDGNGDWWEGTKGVKKEPAVGLPVRRQSVMELPDDSSEFQVTLEAMQACGVSADEKQQMQEVLGAILHLGNIEFTEDEKQHASVVGVVGSDAGDARGVDALSDIAATLGFVPSLLDLKLTQRELSAGGRASMHRVPLTQLQAQQSRDAFAKGIYANLFGWLIEKVNTTVSTEKGAGKGGGSGQHIIGLLDIFGFEIMTVNSFEQLCINYANEVLQFFFNQRVFVKEQKFYADEQVKLPKVWFQDNAGIVELIRGNPSGILQLLDQQNKLGGSGNDKQFLASIYRTHGGSAGGARSGDGKLHPNLVRPKYGGDVFVIKHFAGQVEYTAKGFLAKNNESLTSDLSMLVATTTNGFLKEVFEVGGKNVAASADGKTRKVSRARDVRRGSGDMNKLLGTQTVSLTFREQMGALERILHTTSSHFLRCVKPNAAQVPVSFSGPMVLEQLNYLGVLETIRIRQHGYPVRKLFAVFVRIYLPLAAQLGIDPRLHGDKEVSKQVCAAFLDKDAWQCGVSRVFLKTGQTALLDHAVLEVRYAAATTLQAIARQRARLRAYARQRQAIVRIQAVMRGFLGASRAQRIYHAKLSATALAAFYRGAAQRWKFARTKRGFIQMQAAARGAQYRAHHTVQFESAVTIQKESRRRQRRRRYEQQQWAALRMHTIARGFLGRLLRQRLGTDYKSSQRIQAQARMFVARRRYLRTRAAAATRLQTLARTRQARRRYNATRTLLSLQRIYRAARVRQAVVQAELEAGKSGNLYKRSVRGRRGFNWKYRAFDLTGPKLVYKKVEGVMSKFKTQNGVFLLDAMSEVKSSDIHEHCFMVSGTFSKKLEVPDKMGDDEGEVRELYCYGESDVERNEWMKKLSLTILACDPEKVKTLNMVGLLRLRREVVEGKLGKATPQSNLLGISLGGVRRNSRSTGAADRRKTQDTSAEAIVSANGEFTTGAVKKPRTSLIGRFRKKSTATNKDEDGNEKINNV